MNNLVCSKKDLQSLRKETFNEYLACKLPIEKIDITELSDTMFTGDNYILNKYFVFRDHSVDRLHCFNISNEEYSNAINSLFKKPENPVDLELDTASSYWKKKIFAIIIAEDLGLNPKRIDMSEYIHNPDYYEMYDFDDNMRYLEDKFREEEHELPTYTDRTCVVDLDLIDDLYDFCIRAVKERIAMIFDIYSILLAIEDIRKYTDGYSTNSLKYQMDILRSHKSRIQKIINDKETLDWLKAGNNDDTLYANGKTTKMYIAEYHKIICKLNDVYGDYDVLDLDLDDYECVVNNLADYKNEPYAILINYIHNVIYNDIDSHISRFFAFPDIDNYLMRYIQGLNNKRIKLEALKEVEDNEDVEVGEMVEC